MSKKKEENQQLKRRSPKQARSREKIELMFEAALRILEQDAYEAFTTNRIAAVAGVSVGTLYQYFPDKEALLVALAEREITVTFEQLDALRDQRTEHLDPDTDNPQALEANRVRQAVRIFAQALGGRLKARKQLLVALVRSGQAQLLDERILRQGLAFMATQSRAGDGIPFVGNGLDFIEGFVLARAVSGALRAALLHDKHLLTDPRFEDALCSLITGFLKEQAPKNSGADP